MTDEARGEPPAPGDGDAPAAAGDDAARWRRRGASVALWVVLSLGLIELPHPPEPGLDPSFWQVLVHAHDAGLQFGPDVAFTYGPLGFLRTPFASDGLPAAALLWRTLGVIALAGTVVALTATFSPVRRAALCAALVAVSADESTLVVFEALLVLGWLARPGAPPWQTIGAVAWLALLGHVKFTLLFLGVCGVGVAVATRALAGERRAPVAIPLGFLAALLVTWVAAGQSLGSLPAHLANGWEISSGYVRAMGVNHLTWSVWAAGHVVLGLAALALALVLRGPGRAARAPAALFVAAVWYLIWKHGFVRADAHVLGFFVTGLLLALALPPHLGATRWSPLDLVPAVCVVGLGLFDPAMVGRLPGALPARLIAGARTVTSLGTYRDDLAAREARVQAEHRRADLQERVGRGTIDMLGFDQALLLLNGLDYRPRPVFQGYSAYTPALLRLNRDFFRSSRAPEFVLARHQTIDGRFPTQDDALALAELRLRYEVVHQTLEDVLLRRRPDAPREGDLAREVVLERSVGPGEPIALPRERDVALWLQVEAPPTLGGRLRRFAASEAQLELIVTDDQGADRSFRLIPSMATEGFVVQPLLLEQAHLNAFLRGAGLSWATSLRLEVPRRFRRSWSSFSVRVSRLPQLPVRPTELASELVEMGLIDVAPAEVQCVAPVLLLVEDGRPVLQVHAPGQIVVRSRGARRLTGWFGLRRGIVAPCDGVEFLVHVVRGDGRTEAVWRRHLDPLAVPADAGPQPLDVALPEGEYDVVLETATGPENDGRCDWSYWSELRFGR